MRITTTKAGILIDTKGVPVKLQDGHRVFCGLFKISCPAGRLASDVYARCEGSIRTTSSPSWDPDRKRSFEIGKIYVSLDGQNVEIDTTGHPFCLKDGRVFQGVFRIVCPDTNGQGTNLRASFKGKVLVPLTAQPRKPAVEIIIDKSWVGLGASGGLCGAATSRRTNRRGSRSVDPSDIAAARAEARTSPRRRRRPSTVSPPRVRAPPPSPRTHAA